MGFRGLRVRVWSSSVAAEGSIGRLGLRAKFSLSTRLEDLRLGALSARLHTKVVRGHYEGKNAIRRY